MVFRISLFLFTVTLVSVVVNGNPYAIQPATTPTPAPTPAGGGTTPPATLSGLPPVTAAPECAALATKSLTEMPFPTGESIYWVAKIHVGAAAGATPGATSPAAQGASASAEAAAAAKAGATAPAGGPVSAEAAAEAAAAVNTGTPAPAGAAAGSKCSITSYTMDTCQGVKILVTRNEGGSICIKEAVFDKTANSVALFRNAWLPADPEKAIVKQMFGYYGKMDASGTVTIVDPAPEDIKTSQAKDFVLVGASKGEWAVFASCCKSVVFVMYSETVVSAKSMQTFDAAITPLVTPLGIQFTDLKDITTEISINVDAFIPAVSPGCAAAAAAPTPAVGAVAEAEAEAAAKAAAGGATPAPETPAPTTPVPVTPAPTTPAPVTPAPTTPAPVTPAPPPPTPATQ